MLGVECFEPRLMLAVDFGFIDAPGGFAFFLNADAQSETIDIGTVDDETRFLVTSDDPASPPISGVVARSEILDVANARGLSPSDFQGFDIRGNDGDDVIRADGSGPLPPFFGRGLIIRGNAGDDTIFGSPNSDRMSGGPGNDLIQLDYVRQSVVDLRSGVLGNEGGDVFLVRGAGSRVSQQDARSEFAQAAEQGLTDYSPNVDELVFESALTVEIDPIEMNPRNGGVDSISIHFSHPVVEFDVNALHLSVQNYQRAELSLADAKLSSRDNRTWVLRNISSVTSQSGIYTLKLDPEGIRNDAGSSLAAGSRIQWINVPGDVNGDGVFDQFDILDVHDRGAFQSGQPADWTSGDWNGDGVFDEHDLMLVLKLGHYRQV